MPLKILFLLVKGKDQVLSMPLRAMMKVNDYTFKLWLCVFTWTIFWGIFINKLETEKIFIWDEKDLTLKGDDQDLDEYQETSILSNEDDEKVDDNLFIMVMLAHKEMVFIGY